MRESNRVSWGGVLFVAFLTAACGSDPSSEAAFEGESTDAAASSATERGEPMGSSSLVASEERHCVVDQAGEEACFASFRTALAYATGGATPTAIRASGDESLATLVSSLEIGPEDLPSELAVAKASVVRAILYEHADYRGNSWIIQASDGYTGSSHRAVNLKFKQVLTPWPTPCSRAAGGSPLGWAIRLAGLREANRRPWLLGEIGTMRSAAADVSAPSVAQRRC